MLYVFNTWVVANIIHPIIIYMFIGRTEGEFVQNEIVKSYFLILFFSFIFSLPALFGAWILFYLIRKINIAANAQFITWVFVAAVLPLIVWFCLFRGFGEWDLQKEDLEIILPSSVAVVASIIARVKQFFKLFNY